MRILKSLALAAALLTAPGIVHADEVLTLPDSDTSSLGNEVSPKDSPFLIRCADAATFHKSLDNRAKGLIVGIDAIDHTLVMVFKFKDGSMSFVRSDKDGKNVCIFGTVYEPDLDIGVALQGGEPKLDHPNKQGD